MSHENLVYGLHAVGSLLQQAPQQIKTLYILEQRKDQRLQALVALAQQAKINLVYETRHELDKRISGQQHQGIIALCQPLQQYYEHDLIDILEALTTPPLLLILDGVQDPHNIGACLRSANAAGVNAVIAPKDKSAGLTPTSRKVACGAAESTPFIQVTNLARTLRMLKERGIWLYGLAGEAQQAIYQASLQGPLALILGAEGQGLRRLTRELCDELLHIPMQGQVASLNVSVAAGISLFEVLRQRLAASV